MNGARTIAVLTGSRAEFGLLRSVMRAIDAHADLRLRTLVAGSHLIEPAETWRDVAQDFEIHARITMQHGDHATRADDARALARGIEGTASALDKDTPDALLVLGDRVEAFAGASAASIAGVPLAHLHGGDRAEGIADEAMRHAITKLAHVHFPATTLSAERIERMGEDAERIHMVGSPAIDELRDSDALDGDAWHELGEPSAIVLFHPDDTHTESATCDTIASVLRDEHVLWLHPNHDAQRDTIMLGIEHARHALGTQLVVRGHLSRAAFVGALRRLGESGGVLIGNSSAGLIEAAALRVPTVNLGPRQSGRERANNVIDVPSPDAVSIGEALRLARAIDRGSITHPFGDGRTGERIASILAQTDLRDPALVRKRNAY
ncbi:MAG: UDP-N-acetylglucosamine 2-epimerase [Planctomycetota bacterium]